MMRINAARSTGFSKTSTAPWRIAWIVVGVSRNPLTKTNGMPE